MSIRLCERMSDKKNVIRLCGGVSDKKNVTRPISGNKTTFFGTVSTLIKLCIVLGIF